MPAYSAPVGVTTTVTDAAGNPVEGVVTAYLGRSDGSYFYADSQYLADGRMNLGLEPGTYKFEFESLDGTSATEFYTDKADLATADAVAVVGPTALAPVVLAVAPTATGRVVNSAGRPARGGSVSLYTNAGFVSSARIERDGTFRVGAPTAGSYKLRINASGYASEWFSNKTTLETADLITLGAAPLPVGDITVSRGGVLTGRVVNTPGAGIERVLATAIANGGRQYTDLSDANGVFRIEGVAEGIYKVRFTDPVGEYLGEWFNDKADQATADALVLNGDATVAGIDAALANDPAAVVDPSTVDLSGTVTDSSGAPVIGATVTAYDTPLTKGEQSNYDSVRTNRAGQYAFTELDTDSTRSSENQFKLVATDNLAREEGQYSRMSRWYGGAQSFDAASPAPVPAAGANITLPLTGGISGTVTSATNLSTDGTYVQMVDAVDGSETNGNTRAVAVEEDGTYAATDLVPGTYKVLFADGNFDRFLAPEWFDDTNFENAKTVTVTSGKTATGVDATLEEGMRALRKPEIKGSPYLGGKVRATNGTWTLGSGTSYTYEWSVNDTVVGTGRTQRISKSFKNERLTLEVTASNDGITGTALVQSQVIKKKPKVKVSVNGAKASVIVKAKKVKAKKFKGSVVAKKIVRTDEFDAPVYKKIGKAKLRNGKASLTLKKLTKGKNKVVFFITLKGGKYGDAEVSRTIKIKR